MNRGAVIAVGTGTALLWASIASALGAVGGAAGAGVPATRGSMVQVTPTSPPPIPRVLWMGDSSLEGLKFYSRAQVAIRGMAYVLDAESCRRLVKPSCNSSAGFTPSTALEAIQGAAGSFDAVVIGTGYNENSSAFSQSFDLIVSAARAKGAARVVWMNYRLRDGLTRGGFDNNPSFIANNATLQQKVASGSYPDVVVADWRGYTETVRDWFAADGIHYQPTGAFGAADYISRWITHLFTEPCPMPVTVGGPIANPCTSPDGSLPPDVRALYG